MQETKFYNRLEEYFLNLGEAMRGNSAAARVLLNKSDIGAVREDILQAFLKQHLPSSCNIIKGGFLFNFEGEESKQIDLIVTTDLSPQFCGLGGKSFCCVDGSLAAFSVKSKLDKTQLREAVINLASIPFGNDLFNPNTTGLRYTEGLRIPVPSTNGWKKENLWLLPSSAPNSKYWPNRIIYASEGIRNPKLVVDHLDKIISDNKIPFHKQPWLIVVSGQYCILRLKEIGEFESLFQIRDFKIDMDSTLILMQKIQHCYSASRFIVYKYSNLHCNWANIYEPEATSPPTPDTP